MVGFHILGNAVQTPSSKTDPACSRGERFCYRPALGLVQAEKGWQMLAVYFRYYCQ